MIAGIALALLPPIAGLPLAAYASVACLLIGGIACIPGGVALLLAAVRPPRRPLALLAVERARHDRDSATIAVAGVVASLALSVALTVMVASFRDAVIALARHRAARRPLRPGGHRPGRRRPRDPADQPARGRRRRCPACAAPMPSGSCRRPSIRRGRRSR